MNLVTGEIMEIIVQDFVTCAIVRVGGTRIRVPVMLLPDAKVGDVVLISAGIAISKVVQEPSGAEENTPQPIPTPDLII